MLKTLKKNSEAERILKKYGPGFDLIYFDGKIDGIIEGRNNTKIEIAKNCIKNGMDIETTSECTGLPLNQVKTLQKEI